MPITDRWSCSTILLRYLHCRSRTRRGKYAFAFQCPQRGWMGWVLIYIDDLRDGITRRAKHLSKEAFRGSRIAFGSEQEIDGLPGGVRRSIEIPLLVSLANYRSAQKLLCCNTFISVMKTTELWNCDNLSYLNASRGNGHCLPGSSSRFVQ